MWVTIWFVLLLANLTTMGANLADENLPMGLFSLFFALWAIVYMGKEIKAYVSDAGSLDTYAQRARYAEQFRNPNNV